MPSQLEQLQLLSPVVADTALFGRVSVFAPRAASLGMARVLEALDDPVCAPLLAQTVTTHRGQPPDALLDRLLVRFGCELLGVVPGWVSTELDARLSFDTAAIVARAQRIASLYESEGLPPDRLRVRIPATWEGLQAAKALGHHGVRTHLACVFAPCQAVAAGEAGVPLLSASADAAADVWRYFRKFGVDTEVMADGLSDIKQALALSGCDLIALDLGLLAQLQASQAPLARALDPDAALHCDAKASSYNEPSFRYALNDDAVASERLASGVRAAAADALRLEQRIRAL